MICCSCGKEIDINYGREYWDGIYCKKCADEILSTPEYIKNYEKIIADLKAENAALRERLDRAVELPCKVGDILYTVTITFSDSYEGDIIVRRNGISLSETVVTEKNIWRMCELVRIGKAFFSKEEAIARLKELQGGEE